MTNELVIVTNVVSHDINGLDVVNSVNRFYSGAFDKLFGMVLALIALFGVILPILIQIYQKRVMKVSESELKAEMAKLLESEKKQLLTEVENKFKAEKKIIEQSLQEKADKIQEQVKCASGGVFIIQGIRNVEVKKNAEAAHDFCKAAELFCEGKSGPDLFGAVDNLTKVIKNELSKDDLDYRGLKDRIARLKEKIEKMDEDNFMGPHLVKLRIALDETGKKENPIKK